MFFFLVAQQISKQKQKIKFELSLRVERSHIYYEGSITYHTGIKRHNKDFAQQTS